MSKENSSFDKELKEIIERYETARKENKSLYLDADQYADIADYYAQENRTDDAYEAIRRGLIIHPCNTTLLVELAGLYLDDDDVEHAQQVIDSITVDDNSFDVKMIKSELFIAEDNLQAAHDILDSLEPHDPDDMMDMAYLYASMDEAPKAASWYKKAAELAPDDEEIVTAYAEFCSDNEIYDKATDAYNMLIDKNPYNLNYWIKLSSLYFLQGNFEKMIEASDFALTIDENSADGHIMKGHALLQLEDYDGAIKEYMKARQADGADRPELHIFMGNCHLLSGKWIQAYSCYKHFLKGRSSRINEDPNTYYAYLNSAKCLKAMGEKDRAIKICEMIHNSPFKSAEAYLLHGTIYLEANDENKAAALFGKALEIDPSADCWYLIGCAYLHQNKDSLAEQAFKKVQEIDPNYPEIDTYLTNN